MSSSVSERNSVFISYSHKDKEWLDRLQVHLKPLERLGIVDRWDDTRIKTGDRWKDKITDALANAKVAILLISADFLASDFIDCDELPQLLVAEQENGLIIMPVLLSASRFHRAPTLSQFQAVNPNATPLDQMPKPEQEATLVKLVDDIEDRIKSFPT